MTDKLVQSLFDKAGYKEAKPHLEVVGAGKKAGEKP